MLRSLLSAKSKNKPQREFVLVPDEKEKELVYGFEIPTDQIGEGGQGTVYRAFPVNAGGRINKSDISKCKAVKIIPTKEWNPVEVASLKLFFPTQMVQDKATNSVLIVSSFHPGKTITNDYQKPTPEILALPFAQRIKLIISILQSLNIHHNRCVIHRDIKGSNIQFNIDPETNRVDVTFLDWGLAVVVDSLDSKKLHDSNGMYTTDLYAAPEFTFKKIGFKTDIYACLPIFLLILGATKPFSIKNETRIESNKFNRERYIWILRAKGKAKADDFLEVEAAKAMSLKDYDFTDLFMDCEFKDPNGNLVKNHVIDFLMRMQKSYEYRPDCAESLLFFSSLYQYLMVSDELVRQVQMAKMTLLAKGLWENYPEEKATSSFEKYDFAANLEVCESLIQLSLIKGLNLEKCLPLVLQTKTATEVRKKHLITLNAEELNQYIENLKQHKIILGMQFDAALDEANSLVQKNSLSLFSASVRASDSALIPECDPVISVCVPVIPV